MWDSIVIGGGLAGLTAGIRGSERGKRVLLVSGGTSSLAYASGALDFGHVAALLNLDNHPYQYSGEENIQKAFRYIQTILPEYEGKWGEAQLILTPLGEIRESCLLPVGFSAKPLVSADKIIVIESRNLKDFLPQVFVDNLQRNFPQAKITTKPVQVPDFSEWYMLGKRIPATDYAKYWRTSSGLEQANGILSEIQTEIQIDGQKETSTKLNTAVVIFPGFCPQFHTELQERIKKFSFHVIETSLMPPSPSGALLYENLTRTFKNLGGEIMFGAKVIGAALEDGACTEIYVKGKGKTQTLKAKSYVLANGGILGGGIEVTPYQVREPIFNLPVYVPQNWTNERFLSQQPYALSGINVDSSLHPINKSGETVVKNVYVCGRMLANWDPWTEGCGSGVSIATGYLTGENI